MYSFKLLFKLGFLMIVICCFGLIWQITKEDYRFHNGFEVNYLGEINLSSSIKQTLNTVVVNFFDSRDTVSKDINTAMLEELILQNRYVKKAEVYLDLEGVTNVFIYFDQPFIKLIKNNNTHYLDSEGFELPPLLKVDKNLLIVDGDIDRIFFNVISKLSHTIYDSELLNSLIGGIYYDEYYGYTLSTKMCDLSINLGLEPNIGEDKIDMLKKFYNFFESNLNCDYCKSINIAYKDQVICVK
ncbi:MAG: hypothetical protein CMD26_02750 [Flavobacteriales bacterium]|nr:hypothetical protein [Flavobacteriales bacterium]|tara:strand:+ start:3375 stop:4100 length:726 start_codon:yes stop_codon:yes gene_type:complete